MSLREFINDNGEFEFGTINCDNLICDTINGGAPSGGGSGGGNLTTNLNMNNHQINNVSSIYFSDSGGIHDITVSSGVFQFDGADIQFQNDDIMMGGNMIHDTGKISFTGNDTVYLNGDTSNLYYNNVQLATITDVSKGGWIPDAASDLNMQNHDIVDCGALSCASLSVAGTTIKQHFEFWTTSNNASFIQYPLSAGINGSIIYLSGRIFTYISNSEEPPGIDTVETFFFSNGPQSNVCGITNGNLTHKSTVNIGSVEFYVQENSTNLFIQVNGLSTSSNVYINFYFDCDITPWGGK